MERSDLARLLDAEPSLSETRGDPLVVQEADPYSFMAAFAEGAAGTGPVFLADPNWSQTERQRLQEFLVVTPGGDKTPSPFVGSLTAARPPPLENGWLCIPSGGTSGAIKFARHDETTLSNAVNGFCLHFGIQRVSAVGLLPLHHVSGLMAWMRCVMTGGEYVPAEWKAIAAGNRPAVPEGDDWVISLVPTQLQRLLSSAAAVAWLRNFCIIFVGGGPVWPELTEEAARANLNLSLSYGMTETAAMTAALRPAEFLAGERSVGRALPHAQITLSSQGRVKISSESLFRGYWPESRVGDEFDTADEGHFDAKGHLHILGRGDAMIITGGEKVSPAEVELALRASGEFQDVAVIGVPNPEWGQLVMACFPAESASPNLGRVQAALATLAPYKKPKRFMPIADWPRNAQGKLNRAELMRRIEQQNL